ncbi:MAG TPA: phospho-N-acetylmuramoyl-pentapeptide-transferase [Acidimicrobiales bacterium]|nr:phospho-N-acetylmuramoyl-pentapeptide-transferase [Acidimicrobiales bacterium]
MVALFVAAAVAGLVALFGTKILIEWLGARAVHQPILSTSEGGPGHEAKAGTPTMGGMAIVGAACVGYGVAHLRSGVIFTRTGLLVMLAMIGAGVVGFLDDWIKVHNARNLGLKKGTKMVGLLIVSIGFTVLYLVFTSGQTRLGFTRFDHPGLELGNLGWAVLAVFLISATTNAVNFTDGLDGLASGSAILSFAAFVVIGFWAFRHPGVYAVPHALDLAVVAAAMLGGCAGFLWWNAAPARIIMGDTGALAIGAALACLALSTNTELLLPIVAGLFVLEALSDVIQIASYRIFHRRVFRMAPFHHHFELAGWPETTVVVRFWLIAGACTALALGLYYADFIHIGAID